MIFRIHPRDAAVTRPRRVKQARDDHAGRAAVRGRGSQAPSPRLNFRGRTCSASPDVATAPGTPGHARQPAGARPAVARSAPEDGSSGRVLILEQCAAVVVLCVRRTRRAVCAPPASGLRAPCVRTGLSAPVCGLSAPVCPHRSASAPVCPHRSALCPYRSCPHRSAVPRSARPLRPAVPRSARLLRPAPAVCAPPASGAPAVCAPPAAFPEGPSRASRLSSRSRPSGRDPSLISENHPRDPRMTVTLGKQTARSIGSSHGPLTVPVT